MTRAVSGSEFALVGRFFFSWKKKILHVLRRVAPYKRFLLMATVVTLALIVCIRMPPPVFIPDEAIDAEIRSFIRVNFQLPSPTEARKAIVRRVHFMHKTIAVLPEYRPYVSSWRRVYPEYELYFWTDVDINHLLATRYPRLVSFYRDQLSNPLERSDFARVLILHSFGGWYADLDAGCQVSAESVTKFHSLVIPLEPYAHAMVAFNRRRLVNNAIMYSTAGHPYWMYFVHKIATEVGKLPLTTRGMNDAVFSTGPVIMTRAMEQFAAVYSDRCGGIGDLTSEYWCPYVPGPRRYSPLIDNGSHWMGSWASVMCYTVFREPDITRECERMRRTGFANTLPPDAFTYHAFLHLTGNKKSAVRSNVSDWGLNLRLNPMAHLA